MDEGQDLFKPGGPSSTCPIASAPGFRSTQQSPLSPRDVEGKGKLEACGYSLILLVMVPLPLEVGCRGGLQHEALCPRPQDQGLLPVTGWGLWRGAGEDRRSVSLGLWLPEVGDNQKAASREKKQVEIVLLWGQDPLLSILASPTK